MPTTITLVLTEDEYATLLKAKLIMAARKEREITWKEAVVEAFTEWAKACVEKEGVGNINHD